VARQCPNAKITRVRRRRHTGDSSSSGGRVVDGGQFMVKEGRRKAPSCTKSKASRQRAHHRGGKTRRRTPNAFEASCRQAAGPRIRGFGWQMRKMRRRPNQLQASPCIIRNELLQIACCRSGVARRTRKDDSKSSAPLLRVVTSYVLSPCPPHQNAAAVRLVP
jgi:hypothetical protein